VVRLMKNQARSQESTRKALTLFASTSLPLLSLRVFSLGLTTSTTSSSSAKWVLISFASTSSSSRFIHFEGIFFQ
jgi:hypothetical protein